MVQIQRDNERVCNYFVLSLAKLYYSSHADLYLLDVLIATVDFMMAGSDSKSFLRYGLLKHVNCNRRFSSEKKDNGG